MKVKDTSVCHEKNQCQTNGGISFVTETKKGHLCTAKDFSGAEVILMVTEIPFGIITIHIKLAK